VPTPSSPSNFGDTPDDPGGALDGASSDPAGGSVTEEVSCAMDCTAQATGSISVPGAARVYRLKPSRVVRIAAHHHARLRLVIPRRARSAAAHALRRGRTVTALIVVLVRPAALSHSKGRVLRQRIRLRAPRRHLTRASTPAARRDAWVAQAEQTLGLIGF
jgi:hypothetical protein